MPIKCNKLTFLPHPRYIAALKRIRDLIAKGIKLDFWDDDTIGNKDMECTWGLCSGQKEAWPDAEDHLWPDQFLKEGRVAPLYTKDYQVCPFDRRTSAEAKKDGNGCFYTCRFFNPKKSDKQPDQKEALELYSKIIQQQEN